VASAETTELRKFFHKFTTGILKLYLRTPKWHLESTNFGHIVFSYADIMYRPYTPWIASSL